jgi:hypothetical protein
MCLAWFGLSFGCPLRSNLGFRYFHPFPEGFPNPVRSRDRPGRVCDAVSFGSRSSSTLTIRTRLVDGGPRPWEGMSWATPRTSSRSGRLLIGCRACFSCRFRRGKRDEPRTDVGVRDSWSAANRLMTVSMERRLGLGRDPSAAVAQHVEAAVGQSGPQRRAALEAVEAAPGRQQRFLQHVLGIGQRAHGSGSPASSPPARTRYDDSIAYASISTRAPSSSPVTSTRVAAGRTSPNTSRWARATISASSMSMT